MCEAPEAGSLGRGSSSTSALRVLATEHGIPLCLISDDRTLAKMAAKKPRTIGALLEIKGVGDKKAADLGEAFLAAIGE